MAQPQRHIVWVSVDTYDSQGRMRSSLLGARSVETYVDPHGILDELLGDLPDSYRQLSGDEVAALVAGPGGGPRLTWEQLSIF